MAKATEKALLPAGLQDILPPHAAHEADLVTRLMACFAAHGYERIKAPLIEFEESLLAGNGAAMARDSFRLMDPESRRMIGLRADITVQAARIATTRLANAPRPLRLAYAGDVLRVRGTQLRPERQFGQVGAELIGAAEAEADAEVLLLAAEALGKLGVQRLSFDLSVPSLVPALCRALKIGDAKAAELRTALDRKDPAAVARVAGKQEKIFIALLDVPGPAATALAALGKIDLPPEAEVEAARLAETCALVDKEGADFALTVDPVEFRGFEYHTGLCFTIFSRGVRGEIGSGGRYRAGGEGAAGEPATGFTLYLNTLLRALPEPERGRRLFVPAGTKRAEAAGLREAGWNTVAGIEATGDELKEAARLECTHAYIDGTVVPVDRPE